MIQWEANLKTQNTAIFHIVQWDFGESNAYRIKFYSDTLLYISKYP